MRRRAQPWLGTLVDITIDDPLADDIIALAFQSAFSRIAELHLRLCFHRPDSELSAINRTAVGTELCLHPDTYTVLQAAQKLSLSSNGIFDIRIAGLLRQWDYLPSIDAEKSSPADYLAQQSAFELLPDFHIKKCRNDWLDLGGIAKGYAVDQAILRLQEHGICNAIVNAGGDLRCIGPAREIAIRNPAKPSANATTVHIQNAAMATSATYFSGKKYRDQQVSALVDGSNGHAITSRASITVQAPECIWADAVTKVIAATGDIDHPCLTEFGAKAFIISV